MTFYSKIDTWFLLVMIAVVVISSYSFYVLIAKGNFQQNWIPLLITAILGVGLPISITFGTYYKVIGNNLFVRTSVFSWTIPIETIISVKETNMLSSSPALSTDRILITYDGGSIAISPKDKIEFIEALGIR